MKKETSNYATGPVSAKPQTGRQIFNKICNRVERSLGYKLILERLGRITGTSKSTAGYWLGASDQPQFQGMISLLEFLPEQERNRLITDMCRVMPTVYDRRLSHDLLTVARLIQIAQKTVGLTLIRGLGTDERTFVMNAIGHAVPSLNAARLTPGGLDVYTPVQYVPIDTVLYFREPQAGTSQNGIVDAWFRVKKHRGQIILLNGVYSKAPGLFNEILAVARTKHVILADEFPPHILSELSKKRRKSTHILGLFSPKNDPAFIGVEFRGLHLWRA